MHMGECVGDACMRAPPGTRVGKNLKKSTCCCCGESKRVTRILYVIYIFIKLCYYYYYYLWGITDGGNVVIFLQVAPRRRDLSGI
jgi:hypothetical protein